MKRSEKKFLRLAVSVVCLQFDQSASGLGTVHCLANYRQPPNCSTIDGPLQLSDLPSCQPTPLQTKIHFAHMIGEIFLLSAAQGGSNQRAP